MSESFGIDLERMGSISPRDQQMMNPKEIKQAAGRAAYEKEKEIEALRDHNRPFDIRVHRREERLAERTAEDIRDEAIDENLDKARTRRINAEIAVENMEARGRRGVKTEDAEVDRSYEELDKAREEEDAAKKLSHGPTGRPPGW